LLAPGIRTSPHVTTLPRIDLADMPDALQARLAPRVARLGYLGEFFRVAAHQPEALQHFVAFTEALKAALPPRTVEIVALTVATLTGNDYERVQHERLALDTCMTETEVRQVIEGTLTEPTFTDGERLAAEVAATIVATRGRAAEEPLAELTQTTDTNYAVAVVLTVARYLAHAAAANAWQLTPPVPSPLDQCHAEGTR
jgi:alkylhydroperoxidase family enzyme